MGLIVTVVDENGELVDGIRYIIGKYLSEKGSWLKKYYCDTVMSNLVSIRH